MFGGPGVGSNGLLALSNLNGSNGFKLDGENIYHGTIGMVSTKVLLARPEILMVMVALIC